jgi:hypothetical protein
VGRFAAEPGAGDNVSFADSLAGAAEVACRLAGVPAGAESDRVDPGGVPGGTAPKLSPRVRLRGLFCGGTTGQEAVALLGRDGVEVFSNLHKSGALRTDGSAPVAGHLVLDLGADEFTVGRPHPMIDPLLRNERLVREMEDCDVGVLLFDCVLGYGSHPDPAGVLADGVVAARETARRRGSNLVAVASVTGTQEDPQGYETQKRKLADAGILVAGNNRDAVTLAARLLAAAREDAQ